MSIWSYCFKRFYFAEYTTTKKNVRCFNEGFDDLATEIECRHASSVIKNNWYHAGRWKIRSTGCSIKSKNIYWNKKPNGVASGPFNSICRPRKYSFEDFISKNKSYNHFEL